MKNKHLQFLLITTLVVALTRKSGGVDLDTSYFAFETWPPTPNSWVHAEIRAKRSPFGFETKTQVFPFAIDYSQSEYITPLDIPGISDNQSVWESIVNMFLSDNWTTHVVPFFVPEGRISFSVDLYDGLGWNGFYSYPSRPTPNDSPAASISSPPIDIFGTPNIGVSTVDINTGYVNYSTTRAAGEPMSFRICVTNSGDGMENRVIIKIYIDGQLINNREIFDVPGGVLGPDGSFLKTRRYTTYTHEAGIPEGTYQWRVEARWLDGDWHSVNRTGQFTVEGPTYREVHYSKLQHNDAEIPGLLIADFYNYGEDQPGYDWIFTRLSRYNYTTNQFEWHPEDQGNWTAGPRLDFGNKKRFYLPYPGYPAKGSGEWFQLWFYSYQTDEWISDGKNVTFNAVPTLNLPASIKSRLNNTPAGHAFAQELDAKYQTYSTQNFFTRSRANWFATRAHPKAGSMYEYTPQRTILLNPNKLNSTSLSQLGNSTGWRGSVEEGIILTTYHETIELRLRDPSDPLYQAGISGTDAEAWSRYYTDQFARAINATPFFPRLSTFQDYLNRVQSENARSRGNKQTYANQTTGNNSMKNDTSDKILIINWSN